MVKLDELAEESENFSANEKCNSEHAEDPNDLHFSDDMAGKTAGFRQMIGDNDDNEMYDSKDTSDDSATMHSPNLSGTDVECDRRIRRQIANCNERKRMQSINTGFQTLRQLLPKKDGDKLSKAAILQHTAEFIQRLVEEKRILEEENSKRRKLETHSIDINPLGLEVMECLRTIEELRLMLHKEQQLRTFYERELLTGALATQVPSYQQMSGCIQSFVPTIKDTVMAAGAVAFNQSSNTHCNLNSPPFNPQLISIVNSLNEVGQPLIHQHNGIVETAMLVKQHTTNNHSPPLAIPAIQKSKFDNTIQVQSEQQFESTEPKIQIPVLPVPISMGLNVEIPDPGTKARGLQTILEAIRHLEGDRS